MAQETPGEIPDIRKPDIQLLLQDNAQLRRDLFESRREGDRRVADERERSRWEQDRVRKEFTERLGDVEGQNGALVRTLGRLQAEIDRLREELAALKAARANGHAAEPKPQAPDQEPRDPIPKPVGPLGTGPMVQLVPPMPFSMGKPMPIDPRMVPPPGPAGA